MASALFFGIHIFRTDVIFGDEELEGTCTATTEEEEEEEEEEKKAMLLTPQQSMSLVAVQLTVVAGISVALAAITNADGLVQSLTAAGAGARASEPLDPAALWAMVIYCGVVTTAGCLYFEARALQLVQSQEAALVYTTEPIWGAVFACMFLGERMDAKGLTGAAMILAATAFANIDFSRSEGGGGGDDESVTTV